MFLSRSPQTCLQPPDHPPHPACLWTCDTDQTLHLGLHSSSCFTSTDKHRVSTNPEKSQKTPKSKRVGLVFKSRLLHLDALWRASSFSFESSYKILKLPGNNKMFTRILEPLKTEEFSLQLDSFEDKVRTSFLIGAAGTYCRWGRRRAARHWRRGVYGHRCLRSWLGWTGPGSPAAAAGISPQKTGDVVGRGWGARKWLELCCTSLHHSLEENLKTVKPKQWNQICRLQLKQAKVNVLWGGRGVCDNMLSLAFRCLFIIGGSGQQKFEILAKSSTIP